MSTSKKLNTMIPPTIQVRECKFFYSTMILTVYFSLLPSPDEQKGINCLTRMTKVPLHRQQSRRSRENN